MRDKEGPKTSDRIPEGPPRFQEQLNSSRPESKSRANDAQDERCADALRSVRLEVPFESGTFNGLFL